MQNHWVCFIHLSSSAPSPWDSEGQGTNPNMKLMLLYCAVSNTVPCLWSSSLMSSGSNNLAKTSLEPISSWYQVRFCNLLLRWFNRSESRVPLCKVNMNSSWTVAVRVQQIQSWKMRGTVTMKLMKILIFLLRKTVAEGIKMNTVKPKLHRT